MTRHPVLIWVFGGVSVSAIFACGAFYQRLVQIEECMRTRGCVRISVEAVERFEKNETRVTKVEARLDALQNDVIRRLDRIETKLDK
jgi:hypothetical protein